jgi:hypothetical protein
VCGCRAAVVELRQKKQKSFFAGSFFQGSVKICFASTKSEEATIGVSG